MEFDEAKNYVQSKSCTINYISQLSDWTVTISFFRFEWEDLWIFKRISNKYLEIYIDDDFTMFFWSISLDLLNFLEDNVEDTFQLFVISRNAKTRNASFAIWAL